jgi:oxygen-independent coproporphyrinogen-3 oxidase
MPAEDERERTALYVHIPFCLSKCAYCDFASYPGRLSELPRYLDALEGEMADAARAYGRLALGTVFVGGGTPSLLSGAQMARLAGAIRAHFDAANIAEFTVEANPGTVDEAKLNAYRAAGVNRLSFGAQAAQDGLLRALGRVHRWADVEAAVVAAHAAGFDNINLDLMYALPGQTTAQHQQTVRAAIGLGVAHLSCYSLILEENTPLFSRGDALPGEDDVLAMEQMARADLAAAGYRRYEISNYAQPGRECAHNLVYWRRGDYLGLGCAAHSLMRGERFENARGLGDYLSGARGLNRQTLTMADEREEALMLQTRMAEGIDLAAYRARYGEDLPIARARAIQRLSALSLIRVEGGRLWLTEQGLNVHSAVVAELV